MYSAVIPSSLLRKDKNKQLIVQHSIPRLLQPTDTWPSAATRGSASWILMKCGDPCSLEELGDASFLLSFRVERLLLGTEINAVHWFGSAA